MTEYTREAFHATPARNVPNILNTGLKPSIGRLSCESGETQPRIYLFETREALETAMLNWLGEIMEDSEEKWSILKVRLDDNVFKFCTLEAFEIQCSVQIGAESIELLYDDADEFQQ